ncbi:MAG: chaperonin GroEL, partial [Caldilineaceae bacterium]|nr:chaperonin GroEL [Caldilineaceae bacterium]
LVTDEEINTPDQLVPLLDELRQLSEPNLLIIAPDVKANVLGLLIANHQRGIIRSAAVRPPDAGDIRRQMMEDLCFFTGATLISPMSGYTVSKATVVHLGRAESAHVTAENTTIVDGQGEPHLLRGRIAELKTRIPTVAHLAERQKLERRVAQLAGGLARIRVGGATSAEMENRIEQVEAALASMQATISEGIVPGAGTAFAIAAESLDSLQAEGDEAIGIAVVKRALQAPLCQIAANSGQDGRVVLANVRRLQQETEDWFAGYDAVQQTYCNILEHGIVDSCKTVRTILANAVSSAIMVLTTEVLVIDHGLAPAKRAKTPFKSSKS